MKQTLIKIFQLAIALLIGGLAMTVYIQHRELAAQQTADLVPESPEHGPKPNAFGPDVPIFPPPPSYTGKTR